MSENRRLNESEHPNFSSLDEDGPFGSLESSRQEQLVASSTKPLSQPRRPIPINRKSKKFNAERFFINYARSYIPPMFQWVREYKVSNILPDLISGMTVGVMVIPQGLSFAVVANLDPVMGLYVAMITSFVYFLFGSSKYLIVGPTAVLSLLVSGFTKAGSPPEVFLRDALLLSFLSGLILIILSFARLGFLTNLLSKPISVGFTAAAGVLIAMSQLKYIFGLKMETPETIIVLFKEIIHLSKTNAKVNGMAVLMFSLSFIYIMVLKNIKYTKMVPGPLFAVIMGTLAAYGFDLPLRTGLQVVGVVPKGFPKPTNPVPGWDEIVTALPFAFVVAFISFIESFTIAKPLAIKEGNILKSNQELFALGAANLIGSFFSAFPAAGSFTRTVVNYSTGAKSQVAGAVSGIIVLISVLFLTPSLKYLPYSVLASIVMSGVIGLFEFQEAVYIWKTKKRDFFVLVASFVMTLTLGVDTGVMLSIALHVIILISNTIMMRVEEVVQAEDDVFVHIADDPFARPIPGIILVRVTDSLLYLNIEAFMKQVEELLKQHGSLMPLEAPPNTMMNTNPEDALPEPIPTDPSHVLPNGIVFDFSMVNSVDSSAMMRLEELRETLAAAGYSMHFANTHSAVINVMCKGNFLVELGHDGLYCDLKDAVDHLLVIKKKRNIVV